MKWVHIDIENALFETFFIFEKIDIASEYTVIVRLSFVENIRFI